MKSKYIVGLCFLIVLIGSFRLCNAQSVSINVKDSDKNPLIGATVQLTKQSDLTSVFKTTNQSGIAKFDDVGNTLYSVKISYIGFETVDKSIMIKPNERSFDFRLKENVVSLGEVTISAKTPLIRQEDDKMVIDPENIAHTSTNTLEVLENTPGLYVDQDGGIYLSSATPAKVFINGREQKMSNEDISTILRSLPPGSVQRIEVMRTPSTKYDAASAGGIVNVILKKGVKIGRFGSINVGMNQGIYGNRLAGFTFNNSGDKTTSYINGNYNYNDKQEDLTSNRFMSGDTMLHQSAVTRQTNNQAFTGYGINYDINDKFNFSYDGRINFSLPESQTRNLNFTAGADNIHLSENENQINKSSKFLSIDQDFGLNYKIDTSGSEWETKLSYSYNDKNETQDYKYAFTIPDVFTLNGNGDNFQQRHFLLFQSDLTYKLPLKFKIETGVKSTSQLYSSKSDFFVNLNENTTIFDPLRTNSFNYRENINAAYFQTSKTLIQNFVLKAGVRMEHTFMDGRQTIPNDTSFLVNRVDWFPYVYLSRRIIKIMGVELFAYLIYRRTINRPDYEILNPYINYVDQFMYETGNPALKPQFTNNVEINVSFDDTPLFAIGQNYTSDIFSQVVYQDPNNENIAVRTYDNLGKSKETYFRAMAGIPPGGKYFFAAGAQFNLNEYDGFYEGQSLSYTRGSWRLFTFHALTLFGNTKLTMSGFMMVNGQMNFYELKNFGQLNFGLKQSLFDRKLEISINARDILRTMVVEYVINQGSINAYGDRYTDNRRFGINIRYTFGMGKKDDKKGLMQFEGNE